MDFLKGYRTKLFGWIAALAPTAAMIGFEFDPQAVIDFLEKFNELIGAAFIALGAAIHKFRNNAE